MPNTTTGPHQKNKTHQHKISACSTTTKRRRTQDAQSIARKQPFKSHDEILGNSKNQEAQRNNRITSLHWQQSHQHVARSRFTTTTTERKPYSKIERNYSTTKARIPCITVNEDHIVKVEDMHDKTELVRLQYFAEEAARDDVNYEN
eukprot:1303579-Amphidinium_carterae.2